MKKVAIVCSAGREGGLLTEEAVSRGYDVTGFVRKDTDEVNPKAKKVVKDLFDITLDDLKDFDAVIDAFGAWTPETVDGIHLAVKHLCDVLSGTSVRLLVVGGAGSLYVNPEHTACVADLPSFPDIFKPVATAHAKALYELRTRNDVKWTYLSPAGNFFADGKRTGRYILGGEEYFVNDKGVSEISYADYAIAMIDEVENANNIQKRFSVIGE